MVKIDYRFDRESCQRYIRISGDASCVMCDAAIKPGMKVLVMDSLEAAQCDIKDEKHVRDGNISGAMPLMMDRYSGGCWPAIVVS